MKKAWPVPQWLSEFNYKQSPRCFGAKRKAGRLHAGSDLYAPLNSPVLAIAHGRVVASEQFYLGTYQVTIDHGILGFVLYGEMSKDSVLPVGTVVDAGDEIGRIGSLGAGIHPMLHMEHYSGNEKGPILCRNKPPYFRRGDLQNSAKLLDQLQCVRLTTALCGEDSDS